MIHEENVKVFYIKFDGYDKSFDKFLSKMVVDFKNFPTSITEFFKWFSEKYSNAIIPPTFRMLVAANQFDMICVYDENTEFDDKEISNYLSENNVPYLQCSYGEGDIHYHENPIDCCEVKKNCLCTKVPILKTLKYNEIVHKMVGSAVLNAVVHKQNEITKNS